MVGAEIIIPSPEKTVVAILRLFSSAEFSRIVGATIVRSVAGFSISCAAGVIVGIAAGRSAGFHTMIQPLLSIIRTTPVMSVILIALIWFTTSMVPVYVSLLVSFPIVCGNVIEGVRRVDNRLLEMAELYHVHRKKVLVKLILPSILPFFLAGASTALGITWKVVIAAEVLSRPIHAIGTGLYEAKLQLETAAVFAWTIIAIVLSAFGEALFMFLFKKASWTERRRM